MSGYKNVGESHENLRNFSTVSTFHFHKAERNAYEIMSSSRRAPPGLENSARVINSNLQPLSTSPSTHVVFASESFPPSTSFCACTYVHRRCMKRRERPLNLRTCGWPYGRGEGGIAVLTEFRNAGGGKVSDISLLSKAPQFNGISHPRSHSLQSVTQGRRKCTCRSCLLALSFRQKRKM